MFEYLNEDQIIKGIKSKEIKYKDLGQKHKKNIEIAREAIIINPENVNQVSGEIIMSSWEELKNPKAKVDGLIFLNKVLSMFPEKVKDDKFFYEWVVHDIEGRWEDFIKNKPLENNIDLWLKVLENSDVICLDKHPLVKNLNNYLKKKKDANLFEKILTICPDYASYIPLEFVKNENFDVFMKFVINHKTKDIFEIINSIVENYNFPKESAMKVYKEYLKEEETGSVSENLKYLMLTMIDSVPKKERTKKMMLLALSDNIFCFDYDDYPQSVMKSLSIEDIGELAKVNPQDLVSYISIYKYNNGVSSIEDVRKIAEVALNVINNKNSKGFIKSIYKEVFFDSYGKNYDFMSNYKTSTNINAEKAFEILSEFVANKVELKTKEDGVAPGGRVERRKLK